MDNKTKKWIANCIEDGEKFIIEVMTTPDSGEKTAMKQAREDASIYNAEVISIRPE